MKKLLAFFGISITVFNSRKATVSDVLTAVGTITDDLGSVEVARTARAKETREEIIELRKAAYDDEQEAARAARVKERLEALTA